MFLSRMFQNIDSPQFIIEMCAAFLVHVLRTMGLNLKLNLQHRNQCDSSVDNARAILPRTLHAC